MFIVLIVLLMLADIMYIIDEGNAKIWGSVKDGLVLGMMLYIWLVTMLVF